MSLWAKNPTEITFDDVDAFCKTKQSEGARLDYKGIGFPKDLAKSIAAFANTLGGLLILGVDADKTTNEPIWPPSQGLDADPGLEERVYQIAREAIYPPVNVRVSRVLPNGYLLGKVVLVIRIDESLQAPHAVEKRRDILVYDRDANQNTPYSLADIDRIEYLLSRRNRITDKREQDVNAIIERGLRLLERSGAPIRWAAVGPMYPWRDLCSPQDCFDYLPRMPLHLFHGSHDSHQRIPGGSMTVWRAQLRADDKRLSPVAMSSLTADGLGLAMTYGYETILENHTILNPKAINGEVHNNNLINLNNIRLMLNSLGLGMKQLYSTFSEKPGMLLASVGVLRAMNLRLYDDDGRKLSAFHFPDEVIRFDVPIDTFDFLTDPERELSPLYDQFYYAFDIRPKR